MSYVRMGQDGSAVYLYRHVDGGIHCEWCALDGQADCTPPSLEGKRLPDYAAMMEHIDRHRAAGDHVPDWVGRS